MKKILFVNAIGVFVVVFLISVSIGSVNVPMADVLNSFASFLTGKELSNQYDRIIYHIRIPRVMVAALVGMALALSGAIMQGLLKNPLADGSTLGISSGASLGAALAIVTHVKIPFLPFNGTVIFAVLFAFLSLIFILGLAYRIDKSIANQTVILIGVIFSMTTSSLISLLLAIFEEDVQQIIFWTMGSLAGSTYQNVLLMLGSVIVFGGLAMTQLNEINAFSLGEDHARNLGVNVKRSRMILFLCSSALIGTAVSVGGNISFVGLIIPHLTRILFGSNHKQVFPYVILIGGGFIMLTDLMARTIFSPSELPIGVITSLLGSVLFILIFSKRRQ